MPQTFFTADHHFGHTGIIKMCSRPFESIEEHDMNLIDAWNAVVGPSDVVYHLGDFQYKASPKWTRRVFERLNGKSIWSSETTISVVALGRCHGRLRRTWPTSQSTERG